MSEQRKTNRREFLAGRSAAEAIEHLADRVSAASGDESPSPGGSGVKAPLLMQIGRRAMACEFEVILNVLEQPGAEETALEALDRVDALEGRLSVFRESSEIGRVNREAADRWVAVSESTFAVLQRAVRLSAETDGAFDVTAGPLTKVWGFYRRQGRVPGELDLCEALSRVGFAGIRLNADDRSVRFDTAGLEINLGGIGKGFAVDRAARVLVDECVNSFIIHGGQSSVLARGRRAGADGWTVSVRNPLRLEQQLAEVRLVDRAIGTSGSARQRFYHKGRRFGHILDPRTGRPAEGLLSATAVCGEAADADALATAFYVMGLDETIQYQQSHADVGALLIRPGARSGRIEIHAVGLTDRQWRPVSPTTTVDVVRH